MSNDSMRGVDGLLGSIMTGMSQQFPYLKVRNIKAKPTQHPGVSAYGMQLYDEMAPHLAYATVTIEVPPPAFELLVMAAEAREEAQVKEAETLKEKLEQLCKDKENTWDNSGQHHVVRAITRDIRELIK